MSRSQKRMRLNLFRLKRPQEDCWKRNAALRLENKRPSQDISPRSGIANDR
jgi:hypothetical protein